MISIINVKTDQNMSFFKHLKNSKSFKTNVLSLFSLKKKTKQAQKSQLLCYQSQDQLLAIFQEVELRTLEGGAELAPPTKLIENTSL